MKVSVYSQKGEKISETLLPKEIFDVKLSPDLVHQVVTVQAANRRQTLAHTKDRGEVSGGGRKPWRQKGTGRARHGSIRSPLWKGGGVTFGPRKEKVFKKKINKKMKREALFMVLSAKVKSNLLIIFDEINLETPKTKSLAEIIKNWKLKIKDLKEGSILMALPKAEKNLIVAARNIPKINTVEARNLNVLDLLSFKYLIMPKETIKTIKETFLK
ncbi:MAG: 50S ribosomal protein L4 [Parcubacteria group bacterium CG1_02_39_15]|uniref:Large ribosomal subunit protein uL4 n=5 Tax=Candidatus Nealsoniibacteriota TaxID=1817911 RepID=A0A2G9YSJ2_9BACT|nr:MAG: 50S ribosomal protein L4 [Parcubacteria group bacterium CG1_02_39_15]PIP22187.1 MAG: 50S ribosomal protein L4 [Candidatus Nealsonbacteria bacterium CG23_combo_of_CG06-09_8_20_14_all_39_25]PIW90070.1 MAG: 50S ribosomal protein L4 [Candidatus Nealsonbacteria bacterium CG_4_8_14_3_um_filter_40_11]PIZ88353.1 MAG: 50S ribosomal protein L4 [Candidatus Nealsonbacteria bacterium CG_4_10_14_0_2_um_filter_39_15]